MICGVTTLASLPDRTYRISFTWDRSAMPPEADAAAIRGRGTSPSPVHPMTTASPCIWWAGSSPSPMRAGNTASIGWTIGSRTGRR